MRSMERIVSARTGPRNRTIAIVNTAAGGTGAGSAQRLRDALSHLGRSDAQVLPFDCENGAAQFLAAAADSPDLLVVWGGDGTHRAALDTIGRAPSPLLLLPGGTKNLLSRSVHGHKPWQSILTSVVERSQHRQLPAGVLDGKRFFCAMLAGAPAHFAEAREYLRDGNLGGVIAQLGNAISAIGGLHLTVQCSHRGVKATHALPAGCLVAAVVGPLSRDGMEVATLVRSTLGGALEATWASFQSGFHGLPDINLTPAEALEISNASGRSIPAMIDGESIAPSDRIRVSFLEPGGYCLAAADIRDEPSPDVA
jgi:diacylglycerol kinase family enzyme